MNARRLAELPIIFQQLTDPRSLCIQNGKSVNGYKFGCGRFYTKKIFSILLL